MWQRIWEGFTAQNVFTFFIAVFTGTLWWTSCNQWQTMQQQVEVGERPSVVPSAYVFNKCGNPHGVRLGNYGHKPARVHSWSGQTIAANLLPKGPPLTKTQPIKIVLPDPVEGERIEFDEFKPVPPGSSCYLSGLIEYQFLGHRYCTRFCRYVTPPYWTEHACGDPSTNDFKEDKDCDQYDAERPKAAS